VRWAGVRQRTARAIRAAGAGRSTVLATVVLWAGPSEQADAGVAPLAALGQPAIDLVTDMPYVAVQQLFDAAYPTASCAST